MRGPQAAADLAGTEVTSGLPDREGHTRLEQGHVDMLALTSGLAGADRRGCRQRGVQAGDEVAHGYADLGGWSVWLPGNAHQSGPGLRHHVQAGQSGPRAVLAPPRHRHIHESRIVGAYVVVAEAQPAHRPRPQVFQQDVGGRDQPEKGGPAVRMFQVDGHRPLVAVQPDER